MIAIRLEDDDAGRALDPEEVYVQYHTQHDDRVRPAHAAWDGKVFRLDDPTRPVPPVDWGCRCYVSYVAKPETPAAEVLPKAPTEPTTVGDAYTEYLDREVGRDQWQAVVEKASEVAIPDRLATAFLAMLKLLPRRPRHEVKDLARMAVEAGKR